MVVFEPIEHRYFNQHTGDEYKSVSSVISQFKPKFDSDKWSKYKAKQEGVSQEEILARWDNIRDTANDKGKRIHKFVEQYLTDQSPEDTPVIKRFKEVFATLRDENSNIFSEKILYTHTYKIAGTSDIIEDCGNYFNVYDLKTNKKFRYSNKYNERMLPPLTHLPVCEFTAYSIQLSIYAYMYQEMTGKYPNKLTVLYNVENNWYPIPIVNMRDSVEKIVKLI